MSWQTRKLGDCVRFLSGGTPNKGKVEFWGGDIPWVSSAEMTERFLDDTSLKITAAGLESGSRLVPEGTTFAVVRGMSLAKEFRISLAQRPMAFNQDVKALIPKPGIDGRFIFYSLSAHAKSICELATEAAHGTKKLEMSRLEAFAIHVPEDIETQRKVALAAHAYDDLIATNQRRITLLEDAARRLYREWFIHLRFPGHESVPVKDGVPKGWQRDTLDQALFLQRGFDLPNGQRITGDVPVYASTGICGFHNAAKANGPGVVTGRSGTLGQVHYVAQDFWPLNTSLWVKEFRRLSPLLAYFLLQELDLAQLNSGASVPTLDRKTVHQTQVLLPPPTINEQFDALAQPFFDQVDALKASIQRTAQARDLLLPKLMSGQLDVSGIRLPDEATA
jgi:type I restriction enzyme S subunit